MDRREALKTASLLLGYSISAGTVIAVMNGCKADPSLDWTPVYFNKEQAFLMAELVEMIIPETDTPGAKTALVDRFIDARLASSKQEEIDKFLGGLIKFDEAAMSMHNKKTFLACDDAQRTAILDMMLEQSQSEGRDHIFSQVKEMTVVGYCSSEAGATTLLKHEPVPGAPYKGCIDFSEVGATYAQ